MAVGRESGEAMTAARVELRSPASPGAAPSAGDAGGMDPARAAAPRSPWAVWGPTLAVLALSLAVLFGVFFLEEASAAIRVWDSSTAYNHCWLVLPVALWLAANRRDRLAGLAPAPWPAAALLGLPAAAAWFAAERLGIMEGRQFAVMGLVWTLFLAVLGWRVFRAMAAPIVYLIFLVPFGEFLTPLLQTVTAEIIDVLLDLWGIPHFVDNLIIEIPEGSFWVAEACAGLRFLIAAIAFGALYAMVMFRSPGRRLIVMALSLIVPVIANGIRAFGIVLLGHYLGSAEAGAADHVIYGWVFFSIVILLLILAGLPFREDLPAARAADGPRPAAVPAMAPARPAVTLAAGAVALLVAASGPALAARIQGGGWGASSASTPTPTPVPLAAHPGCVADGPRLRCGPEQAPLIVTAQSFAVPPRASWAAIGAARARAIGEQDEHDTRFAVTTAGGVTWQGRARHGAAEPRATATGLWLAGAPGSSGLRARLAQAVNSVSPSAVTPVLLVVQVTGPVPASGAERGSKAEEALLREILGEQGQALSAVAASHAAAFGR